MRTLGRKLANLVFERTALAGLGRPIVLGPVLFFDEPGQRLQVHWGDVIVAELLQPRRQRALLVQLIGQFAVDVLAEPELAASAQIDAKRPSHTVFDGRRQALVADHAIDVACGPDVNRRLVGLSAQVP